ncbi:MAG: M23 family metallopeptidase [Bacteroidales bacterium]|jgi:hypothetical protein
MKKKPAILLGINLLIACQFHDQMLAQGTVGPEKSALISPLSIPIFLAGNFGEPRANHFHSGIDIKTNGSTGLPVRSVAEGYVSRIKVDAGGYGRALYIRHPNGFTSLYGHLQSYNEAISKYVYAEQYRRESFAVDLFPEPGQLVIQKGQLVAYSGNSGSSEGPHLHFELRETQSENPVNPLIRSIEVKDDLPPVIEKIYVYSLRGRREWIKPVQATLIRTKDGYRPAGGGPLPVDNVSGLGIETYDLLNGSDNHCGAYKIKGYLDDKLYFESRLDEISFAETRYMNSFMDYKLFITNHKPILKLFIDPNNQATIYKFANNRGRIELKDNKIHKIKIAVSDAVGNESVAEFNIVLNSDRFGRDPDFLPFYTAYFNCQESNSFQAVGLEVTVPERALYDDIYFDYSIGEARPGSFSPLHQIHHSDVPVHLYYRLAIEAQNLPENLKSIATIAQYLGGNRYSCLGGTWEGNRLIARTRSFGSFCIMADSVKPVIAPLNFSSGSELKTLNTIKFTVKDDFAGVQSFRGEIDGKWVLLEYDAKTFSLEYRYDSARIKAGIQHKMVVRATDQLGNTGIYSVSFFR